MVKLLSSKVSVCRFESGLGYGPAVRVDGRWSTKPESVGSNPTGISISGRLAQREERGSSKPVVAGSTPAAVAINGPVAQQEERGFPKAKVAGSSPARIAIL